MNSKTPTCLHLAAANGHEDALLVLFSKLRDPNKMNGQGKKRNFQVCEKISFILEKAELEKLAKSGSHSYMTAMFWFKL